MDYRKEAVKKFGNYYTINKNNPDEWLFPCKLCKKLNDKNLHVNVKTGLYNCFHNCSNHGKLFKKYSLNDVKSNITTNNSIKTFSSIEHDTEYLYPFCRLDLTDEQRAALYSRGITDEQIEYYNICGGKRIQIPNKVIGQFTDLVCNWEYRKQLVTKQNPKYLYSSDVKKSNVVFNLHRVPEKANVIIVCEGIFNAITASKLGVATYGCNPSVNQVKQILGKSPENIIIAYDSDLPGVTGSSKLINLLRAEDFKGGLYYILLPKGVDINDIGHKNFLKYLEEHKVKIILSSPFAYKLPKLLFDSS